MSNAAKHPDIPIDRYALDGLALPGPLELTPVERLVIENQVSTMWALSNSLGVGMSSVRGSILKSESALGRLTSESPILSHFKKSRK